MNEVLGYIDADIAWAQEAIEEAGAAVSLAYALANANPDDLVELKTRA